MLHLNNLALLITFFVVTPTIFGFAQEREYSPTYLPGDVSGDGKIQINDAILILKNVFLGEELPCELAGEFYSGSPFPAHRAIFIIQYLFLNGAPVSSSLPKCKRNIFWNFEDRPTCKQPPDNCELETVIFLFDNGDTSSIGEPLAKEKREIISRIHRLPAGTQFAIIIFGEQVKTYPADSRTPVINSPANIGEAISFISTIQTPNQRKSCGTQALDICMQFAENASQKPIFIDYFASSCFDCDTEVEPASQTRTAIRETLDRNSELNARFFILHVSPGISQNCKEEFKLLAEESRGYFFSL